MMRDININQIATGWKNLILKELGFLDAQTKALADKRLSICETCPDRKGHKCGICGCIISAKSASPTAICPANPPKWPKI